jgi:hypothetical protein
MSTSETNSDPESSTLSGWWYVLLLLLPALWIQGFFLSHRFKYQPDHAVLLIGDSLILLRATLGLVLQRRSSGWWVYASLYFLQMPLIGLVMQNF